MPWPMIRGPLHIPGIDLPVLDAWYRKHELAGDAASKFIFGWVVFNHLFVRDWEARYPRKRGKEFEKIQAFIALPEVIDAYKMASSSTLFGATRTIKLPLQNRNGTPVPDGTIGERRMRDLTPSDYFAVVYEEVRNQWTHGASGAPGVTQKLRCDFTASFGEFLKFLARKVHSSHSI